MINCYIIEIIGKNPKYFLKKIINLNINVLNIKYDYNRILLKVTYNDYLKINEIKTTYKINILKIYGIKKIEIILKKYKIFLMFFIISLILILIFSKMIFYINIEHSNKEIVNLIKEELNNNEIKLYTFFKSYKQLEIIENKIKNNNKDKIEWIEIEHIGTTYNIKVIERKLNNINNSNDYKNIIASHNGLIIDMYVSSGEIVKVKGDYVNKGDIIVSGLIKKDDNIVNQVEAKAKVYAEVWYKTKMELPYVIKEQVNDSNGYKILKLKIFNKEITLYKNKIKNLKKSSNIKLLKTSNMELSLEKNYNLIFKDKKYSQEELIKKGNTLSRNSILEKLSEDENILLQKTLKIEELNDKIYMEMFFKVYKNIAIQSDIIVTEDEGE